MDVLTSRRIVLLGKTGVGKSSLANTILGEDVFRISHSPISEKSLSHAETKSVNGRSITLIDTHSFFDTCGSETMLKAEIVRCITECAPGPHAFLIVLTLGRFTKQEQGVINKICQCFSEEAFKYTTVLFTHGDQLPEGETVENLVRQNESVSDLVKKCRGRCHVIDNKYWKNNQRDEYRSNKYQVKELLRSVDKTIEANKGSCYTNKMLQAVEDKIRQQQARIGVSAGNVLEVRQQAKGSIFNALLTNPVGLATDTLLKAFTGEDSAVAKFLAVLAVVVVALLLL